MPRMMGALFRRLRVLAPDQFSRRRLVLTLSGERVPSRTEIGSRD